MHQNIEVSRTAKEKIEFSPSNTFRWKEMRCHACGEVFPVGYVHIYLYSENAHLPADICEECFKAGPNAGMRERIYRHAQQVREFANRLEKWAAGPPIESQSYEMYAEAQAIERKKEFAIEFAEAEAK